MSDAQRVALPLWVVHVTGTGGQSKRELVAAPSPEAARATAQALWVQSRGVPPVKVGQAQLATAAEVQAWRTQVRWREQAHRREGQPAPSSHVTALLAALDMSPAVEGDRRPAVDVEPRWTMPAQYRLGGVVRLDRTAYVLGQLTRVWVWLLVCFWPSIAAMAYWYGVMRAWWGGTWWVGLFPVGMAQVVWGLSYYIGTEEWFMAQTMRAPELGSGPRPRYRDAHVVGAIRESRRSRRRRAA